MPRSNPFGRDQLRVPAHSAPKGRCRFENYDVGVSVGRTQMTGSWTTSAPYAVQVEELPGVVVSSVLCAWVRATWWACERE